MKSFIPVMCMLTAVFLTHATPAVEAAETMTLQNGREITPYPDEYYWDRYRYYGCQETVLDPTESTNNFGGMTEDGLIAGSGRKVLIQFKNLHRAIGPNKQIVSARIVFHVTGNWSTTNTVNAYRLLKPWRQGSMTTEDAQPQHWTTSFNDRLYSDLAADRLVWASPGASAVDVDRSSTASVSGRSTGLYYNAANGTWMLPLSPTDVEEFYANPSKNFGWVIEYATPASATGENRFYTSETQDITLRPEMLITYNDTVEPARDVDLTVQFISRTPEYFRYDPSNYEYKIFHDDNCGILKSPTYANETKHPDNGDVVTFTAHVKNQGLTANSGPFNYRWLMNGEVIATGSEPTGLVVGEVKTYDLNWTWDCNDYANDADMHRKTLDTRDRELQFEVDYDNQLTEFSKANNTARSFIEAPGIAFYVEQSIYDMYAETLNQMGTYSFEDYLNWHVRIWNDNFFGMSRYEGFAEDGCVDRVRVHSIQIYPDGGLCPGGAHTPACLADDFADGGWGWVYDSVNSPDYVTKWSRMIEWGLLHECTHQLGMIDLYNMNNEAGTTFDPMRVKVHGSDGNWITRGFYWPYGGLMGGGDTRYAEGYEANGMFSGWTVGALNSNVGFRRGYYGEQLYDLPPVIKLRPLDGSGTPIPNAQIRIWQGNQGQTSDGPAPGSYWNWQPIIDTTVDADGTITLPNVDTLEDGPFTTITGHTLAPNPWGRINVVGSNSSMLVRITAYGQEDYRFIRLPWFNIEYWKGQTEEIVRDIRFDIAPSSNISSQNFALNKPVTVNGGGYGDYAVDGNLDTRWGSGGTTAVGDYWQVDLGQLYNVAQVIIKHRGYSESFYEDFRIETSTTGAFLGEERFLDDEEDFWGNARSTRRDMDPEDQSYQWVTYAGYPALGRYVRITCEKPGWVNCSEIEVYALGEDTTPPAAITDLEIIDYDSISATLIWTAPGNDGMDGLAEEYDLRYSTSPITEANFASAIPIIDAPLPLAGGAPEIFIATNLPDAQRYFAIKTKDPAGNWSAISNIATRTPGNVPPVIDAGDDFEVDLPLGIGYLHASITDDGLPNPPAEVSVTWQYIDGPAPVTIDDPTAAITQVTFDTPGEYVFQLDATDGEFFRSDTVTAYVYETGRITDGLVVLYEFEEGEGDTVYDTSTFGTPLNLTIADPNNVTWTAGGLRLDASTRIATTFYGTKVIGACMQTDEITIEAWIQPSVASQAGPAKIITVSPHANSRDFSLDQGNLDGSSAAVYGVRLRTTETNDNGEPGVLSTAGAATAELQHVVYTRDALGNATLYVDNNVVATAMVLGDFSSWTTTYRMVLGNEYALTSPWLGEYRLVAIYDAALSVKEVERNYEAGPEEIVVTPGDANCDGTVDVFDIDPFVQALVNPGQYAIDYPTCNVQSADCNNDGVVDVFDIDPFVMILVGS